MMRIGPSTLPRRHFYRRGLLFILVMGTCLACGNTGGSRRPPRNDEPPYEGSGRAPGGRRASNESHEQLQRLRAITKDEQENWPLMDMEARYKEGIGSPEEDRKVVDIHLKSLEVAFRQHDAQAVKTSESIAEMEKFKVDMAMDLLSKNCSVDTIVSATRLSKKEIARHLLIEKHLDPAKIAKRMGMTQVEVEQLRTQAPTS